MMKSALIGKLQQKQMDASIRDVYIIANHIDSHGVEGYHVDKKYYDPMKMKEQRILETSKDRIINKPPPITKKICFIDEIQKKEAKLPGPCSYQPKQIVPKSKTESLVPPTHRKTIFDQMQHVQKKQNFPGAGTYGQVSVDVDKTKLKSNLSKAENSNYLDSSMRYSLQSPGVGNYNAYHAQFDKKGNRWVNPDDKKGKQRSKSVKLPPVGTYSPLPVAYQLFDNELSSDKKRYKPYFNKEERFKKSRDKPLPFYNILSEWGVKQNKVKKDILTRISSPSSHRSVYH